MPGHPSAGGKRRPFHALAGASAVAMVLTVQALPAGADIMPPERRTTWNPGIPGGIPVRTTVCATVNASTYGNGTSDATSGIQAAVNACPVGQVVQLSAGDFLVDGPQPIFINKGIVLRGAGPSATRLRKTSTVANPIVLIGERWPAEAASVNLTANAAKGATSVQVASSAGLSVGQLVLIDEITDQAYVYWGIDANVAPGAAGRGWFTRYDRPVGQMLEIASISGNTISFTTPLHIAFDTAHTAQLTRYTIPYGARYAGVEDLYVRGGYDDNVTIRFAMYSWIKNVESDWSYGDAFALDSCFRCVLRDSYAHDVAHPYPGGAGYLLSLARYTADSLVENSIFINGNKVMVMRASGGGNVIGYNYFDNGYIGNYLGWVETGMNASHMTCPHFELFEGNQAFNIDGDDTWGGAVYNTFFRNNPTGKRRSYPDNDNRRAIGLMYGHYYYSFVGNVLGTPDENPAPYGGFVPEDFFPWTWDPVGLWRIGYTPLDWNAPADPLVVGTVHRHGNFEFATNSVAWKSGFDQTLPDSLYLTSKPAFFGNNPWPWVTPTGATKLFTLPARARYDAGNPNGQTLTVTKGGSGGGTVTSSPAGINCGLACSAGYATGAVVTLTAAADAVSSFAGWSGACTGTASCQVTMSAARSVAATFTLVPVNSSLNVTKSGSGAGTVTSSPAGINCGAVCSAPYLAGTSVTLTASAAAGSTFAGWSSGCSGTGSCPVTVGATATSVTATFTTLPGVDTGRLAHWKLDEGTGLSASDASGNGNTGALVGGAAWTAGRSGKAVSLDGVDDYVSAPHTAALDAYPLSVAGWFKTATASGLQGLVNKYLAGSFNGYQIFFENGDLCAWYLRDNASFIYDGTGCSLRAAGFNDGQWHHVAFVADASGGRLYVDALLMASLPWTGSAGPVSTVQEIRLGQYPGANGGGYLAGAADDVRIYGRALFPEEIAALYSAAPPTDTTPPVLSLVAAGGVGPLLATITWTTDEPADSQVEYGLTTGYGSATGVNANLLLAHSQALTGLAAGTAYHYRVKSRDASGNLAVSGDFTFTTSLLPALSVNDVTVTEGNSGTVSATFNVTLSPAAIGTVTVGFATANGTATAGSDYVASSGTLTFNPGNTVKTVTVVVNGDATVEGNETFFVNLSAPSGATLADNQGQGTITNDDTSSAPVTCPATVSPGGTFNVTVNGGSSAKDWMASYVPGSPNNPWLGAYQYVPLPRPAAVSMTAPAASGAYELRLLANDTFTVIGSCAYQVGTGGAALSVNDVTVTEGNSGTVSATFNVTLSPPATGTVTVGFATANGTATAGSDYVASSGTLTFNPGDTVKAVTVVVNGDTTVEGNETFFVNLSAPTGATLADNQGQGTITNDDGSSAPVTCPATVSPGGAFNVTVNGGSSAKDWMASYAPGSPNNPWLGAFKYVPLPRPATVSMTAPATPGAYELRLLANDTFTVIGSCAYQVGTGSAALSVNDVTVTEGNSGTVSATFNVTLSPAATGTVTVGFTTADGTATAGSDYVASSGTLTFNPGDTVKTVTVVVNGDTTVEGNETFFVNLSAPTGATLADNQGQGTITNDDASSAPVTCPSATVAPGAAFNVTVNGGSSATDWLASYLPGSPNNPWLGAWKYAPLPRPATVTMTAPSAAGAYDLRLLANDSFTLIGSCTYQVTTAP